MNKRRPRHQAPMDLAYRTIGNAMVVHAKDALTNEAMSLAMSVAPDPHHDLVVVDLPTDVPIGVWESVATHLPRGRRGVRLVLGGRSREATALAGQWLAQRIGRPVIAPDGMVVRGASGALFVHSGQDSGWVRFRPGHPPQWAGKRFPRPSWDAKVFADSAPTSSTGVAEPLPGGVWIRPVGHDAQLHAGRGRLINEMPCQAELLTVVLGCPGTPAISVDDVLRFCATVPDHLRASVRFVHYGPVAVPPQVAVGQALADGLGAGLVCYTGLPVGSAQSPDVFTVHEDGSLGWNTFATSVFYRPPEEDKPTVPTLHGYRRPVHGVAELAPAVFWYTPDAVVEVVQAGLWVRPTNYLTNAEEVRATPADPGENLLVFDGATQDQTQRMRTLAEDVLGRLDLPTRRVSRVVPASALAQAGIRITGLALAEIDAVETDRAESDVERTMAIPAVPAQLASADPVEHVAVPGPVEPAIAPPSAPAGIDALEDDSERTVAVPAPQTHVASAATSVETPVAQGNAPALPAAPYSPDLMRLESAPADATPPSAPEGGGTTTHQAASRTEPKAAPTTTREATAQITREATAKRQPTPEPAASALLPTKGIDEERAWLRKNLGPRYGVLANTIARVLSEHPGLQGAVTGSNSDVLTEAVAVQLYLGPEGAEIDRALRTAKVGPHVPFARCVVAGLRRLPSHRGATVFTMTPTSAQWDLYRGRKLLTEWGFVNALSEPCSGQEGNVDVLVWSMTARRTKLLEPEGQPTEDRVLFVPGTSFKVLDATEPTAGGRGQILLRELALSEIDDGGKVDANRASLDDLAMTSLRRCADRWAAAKPKRRIPESLTNRFQALPGLA
ncbi:hypothetical protein ACQPZF_25950 [Actinosynnema sp. CS-041913]|uniref:hypothetical protein n=1 Tax=Actinosynnema sp. CS-041913 TaxID=3239917 RepID=UPI003D936189